MTATPPRPTEHPALGQARAPPATRPHAPQAPPDGTVDPPESGSPAAGVCALATNPVSDVSVKADFVPMPRCLVIRHDQRLSVTNEAGATITVTLGTHFKATIDNGTTYAWPTPVGTYLAPGVHRLVFSAASAADIWVDAECTGPGATGCTTP